MTTGAEAAGVLNGYGSQSTTPNVPNWYGQLGEQFANTISGALGTTAGLTGNWYDQPLQADITGAQQQALTSAGQQLGGVQSAYAPVFSAVQNAMAPAQGMSQGLPTGQQTLGAGAGAVQSAATGIEQLPGYSAENLNQFLSPFTGGVLDRIQREGNRNLNENILPGINSTFTGAGQFGSRRNADFTNRAVRDTQQAILDAQATAGNAAYQNAMQDYLSWNKQDLSKLSTLANAGSTLGNLGVQQATVPANVLGSQAGTLLSGAGQQQSAISNQQQQQATLTELLSRLGAGAQATQQGALDKAYQDYLNQINVPINTLGALSGASNNATARFGMGQNATSVPATVSSTSGADAASTLAAVAALLGKL